MKKLLSIALAIILVLSLAACGTKTASTPDQSASAQADSTAFVKPETYASVVLITINPQFRLYLDAAGEVLAVEPVNDDAKSIADKISTKTGSIKSVVQELVTATNQGGFAKENATVKVEITEIKAASVDTDAILTEAKTTANASFAALEIPVTVETAVAEDALDTAEEVSSVPAEATSSAAAPTSSEKAPVSSKKKETHTHAYTAATCTKPKTCSCGATSGKALGHNYKEGVCSRCKAKDKNYVPSYTSLQDKGGFWNMLTLNNNELYDVNFTLYLDEALGDEAGYGCSFAVGDPATEDMLTDPEMSEYIQEYNGKNYYFGRGDGDALQSVTESSTTVTITDLQGNKLVLSRTSETTMKVTSSPASFVCFGKVPVGTVLTFVKE